MVGSPHPLHGGRYSRYPDTEDMIDAEDQWPSGTPTPGGAGPGLQQPGRGCGQIVPALLQTSLGGPER
jgi:hypothetical protein